LISFFDNPNPSKRQRQGINQGEIATN